MKQRVKLGNSTKFPPGLGIYSVTEELASSVEGISSASSLAVCPCMSYILLIYTTAVLHTWAPRVHKTKISPSYGSLSQCKSLPSTFLYLPWNQALSLSWPHSSPCMPWEGISTFYTLILEVIFLWIITNSILALTWTWIQGQRSTQKIYPQKSKRVLSPVCLYF